MKSASIISPVGRRSEGNKFSEYVRDACAVILQMSSGDSMPDVARETASLQSEAGAGTFMSCLDLLEDEPSTSDT